MTGRRWLAALALVAATPAGWGQIEEVSGAAALREWVQPAFPDEARRQKLEGRVVVEFVVDASGAVREATIAESTAGFFEEPALVAVRQWKFAPALDEGKPVECGMSVPIEFPLAQLKQKRVPVAPPPHLMPRAAKRLPARAIRAPDPEYPAEFEERKLPGEVQLELTVDATGRVLTPRVIWASHAAFVEEALRAAEASTFEPARQGVLARASTLRYPVSFVSFGAKRADILAANRVRLEEGPAVDVLPEPFALADPVYPFELLLAGTGGAAEVSFTLGAGGYVSNVTLVAASHPEFGAALVAAVEGWAFRPALKEGARVPVRLRVAREFAAPTGAEARLVGLLSGDAGAIAGPGGLDGRLTPLWRGFPGYPNALRAEAVKGEAEIEFIIDRAGRARLPRVVSATRPEFGWAAATAINQWVFARPRRGGEPTDVRVRIPVNFTPPAE